MGDSSNILVVGAVVVMVLFATGMLVWTDNTLFFQGDEIFSLDGDVDGDDYISAESTLQIAVGYIDGEGNWITPSEAVAQSVFWAGTTNEVADVFVNPTLDVVHDEQVVELPLVSYSVSLQKVDARVEGDTEYMSVAYGDSLIVFVDSLSVDGGSLANTSILGDVLGIDVAQSDSVSGAMEDFLWEAISAMGLEVSQIYVEEGTFLVYTRLVIQIDSLIIDYVLDDGSTGQYVSTDVFTNDIELDLEFVITSTSESTETTPSPETEPMPTIPTTTEPPVEEEPYVPLPKVPITDLPDYDGTVVTYSVYVPSVGVSGATMGLILIGAGVLGFLLLGNQYRKQSKRMFSGIRRRKRR